MEIKRLNLYLIKPSKYDDDGYIIRYWKGVLPSNTLACLNGLSLDLQRRQALGAKLQWNIHCIDETVQEVKIQNIVRSAKAPYSKTVICLVGVQSNQFPRAADLAMAFRKSGLEVLIGGFHVSGIMATLNHLTPELEKLQQAGVTLIGGEIEYQWEQILRDAVSGTLKPVYNFLHCAPDLQAAPMPEMPVNLLKKYAVSRFATLDCGRGCPYQCSFCTVINVQGRKMRFRCVESILDLLRRNYHKHRINFYFFTDDNFSRNKNWEAIFEGLIRMRESENIKINFMIQVDTQSHKIPGFVAKAGLAGCKQVFIGMESLNEDNLQAVGKKQNRVAEFHEMSRMYHEASIVTHLAYIIGFPFDSRASVKRDILRLQHELGAEQASFFMLTPLPGSEDYRQAVSRGMIVDSDLNNFDSFHETFRHSRIKPLEWTRLYDWAWKSFYHPRNMKAILSRISANRYWNVFYNFIWYKNAIQVEKGHPMIHGFIRMKGRRSRRPGYPVESRFTYFKRRFRDITGTLTGWVRLAFEMEEVWLATRRRSPLEERVLMELSQLQRKVKSWHNLRLSELEHLYRRSAEALEKSSAWRPTVKVQIPSKLQLWFMKWSVIPDTLTATRLAMTHFWLKAAMNLRRGKVHRVRWHRIFYMSIREGALLASFFLSMIKGKIAS